MNAMVYDLFPVVKKKASRSKGFISVFCSISKRIPLLLAIHTNSRTIDSSLFTIVDINLLFRIYVIIKKQNPLSPVDSVLISM